jgi:hypothetical protein
LLVSDCRLCGGLVCNDCSAHKVDLLKFNFTDVRVCNLCFAIARTMDVTVDQEQGTIIDHSKAPKFPVLCGPGGKSEIYENASRVPNSRLIQGETATNTSSSRKMLTK